MWRFRRTQNCNINTTQDIPTAISSLFSQTSISVPIHSNSKHGKRNSACSKFPGSRLGSRIPASRVHYLQLHDPSLVLKRNYSYLYLIYLIYTLTFKEYYEFFPYITPVFRNCITLYSDKSESELVYIIPFLCSKRTKIQLLKTINSNSGLQNALAILD